MLSERPYGPALTPDEARRRARARLGQAARRERRGGVPPRAGRPAPLPPRGQLAPGWYCRPESGITQVMPGARDMVVVGASAGGVEALTKLVRSLPRGYTGTLFVVLHIAPEGTSVLDPILERAGVLPAETAKDGDVPKPGHIYVAPPNFHLLLNDQGRIVLSAGPKENGHRPAVDTLFRSAAAVYGPRCVGRGDERLAGRRHGRPPCDQGRGWHRRSCRIRPRRSRRACLWARSNTWRWTPYVPPRRSRPCWSSSHRPSLP